VLAPQDISIYLNNALKPTHYQAELDSDTPLPEAIRDMPDRVSGHIVALAPQATHEIEAAWKRIMILNATQVLYTFTFDSQAQTFRAVKRCRSLAMRPCGCGRNQMEENTRLRRWSKSELAPRLWKSSQKTYSNSSPTVPRYFTKRPAVLPRRPAGRQMPRFRLQLLL
jgi:hypothetical protein